MATAAREDVGNRRDLVTEHLDLIQHAVNQVAVRYPRHVDRQELWNAGALGLVDAARRYDPSTGIPFARYAMIRIRGAIIDSTRSRDWASRSLRRGMREVRRANEHLAQRLGRQPSREEVADHLGIDVERVEGYRRAATNASLLHLDQQLASTDAEQVTLADTLEELDPSLLPEQRLEHRELVGTLRTAIEHLPEIQRTVVERYYFHGDFLKQIADDLGVTEARVSQIRSEALNAIRAYFATGYETVPGIDDQAPGRRARASFVSRVATQSTWRSRLEASDRRARQLVHSA